MPEINITVFKNAIDVLDLFRSEGATAGMPVYVVETDRTLALRPFSRQLSIGLVIPKAIPGSRGLNISPTEMASDESEGVALGSFRSVQELKRRLRGVRTARRRWDGSLGYVEFEFETDPALRLYEPSSRLPVTFRPEWDPGATSPRLPVYLSRTGDADRVLASSLNALGQAGRKLAPNSSWSHRDGRWEIKNSQGSTLRAAMWPTNP